MRGEVFMSIAGFLALNEHARQTDQKTFANPRNAASGSLRQKNSNDTKKIPLKFIAYTFGFEKGLKIQNQENFLKKLSEWGFKTNDLNKTITGTQNLMIKGWGPYCPCIEIDTSCIRVFKKQ